MSTGCEFYADALVDLARGDLERERAERVEGHLAGCEACRGALEVIRAVRAAPAPVPAGLEARIRDAVRGGVAAESSIRAARAPRPNPWRGWRPWALPVAAVAALALWIGAAELLSPGDPGDTVGSGVTTMEYVPYGAWPGSNGELAGDLVLSELSVEELEALLEEMQS